MIDRIATEKKHTEIIRYDSIIFGKENCIIPPYYELRKIIECGKAVICWIENTKTGKTIKTVAKCHDEDKFDLHKGVEICMYKTLRKIADKNLKRF